MERGGLIPLQAIDSQKVAIKVERLQRDCVAAVDERLIGDFHAAQIAAKRNRDRGRTIQWIDVNGTYIKRRPAIIPRDDEPINRVIKERRLAGIPAFLLAELQFAPDN